MEPPGISDSTASRQGAGQAFDIVAYDEREHRGFVVPTFLESMSSQWLWATWPHSVLEHRLLDTIHRGARALVATAPGEPDVRCGWLVAIPERNLVIAAYTLRKLRRRWGIATALAEAAGIDMRAPVGVWFWTYACERMVTEHGKRLYHRVTELE